jgi:3-mercaptopropionate dioxygenase
MTSYPQTIPSTGLRKLVSAVRNAADDTAISIHIYGTDVSRIGSSVRRYYDHPVVAG